MIERTLDDDADAELCFDCFGQVDVAGTACQPFDMNEDAVVAQPGDSLVLAKFGGPPGPSANDPPLLEGLVRRTKRRFARLV